MSLSKKKIALRSAAAFGALVLIVACGTDEGTPAAAEQAATVTVTETEVVTETEAAPTPEVETETKPAKPAPKPKPKPKPELTVAQENAIESARSYLDFAGFSRKGLIDQLVYEGYSKKDATIAVDRIKPNWRKEAVQSAESYLDFSSFSRSGLIEQLEYEGYTPAQAAYAVKRVGL
jgi:Host cell surface-exposed lipoprotein